MAQDDALLPPGQLPPLEEVTTTADEVVAPAPMDAAEQIPVDLNTLNKELDTELKYGDRPIEAYIRGALSGATFGLSEAAERALLGTTPERQREVGERNIGAETAGLISGILGSAAATGGTSAGAKLLGTGAAASAKTGLAAEQALVKAAPKLANSIVAKAATRGAAEGALQGLAQGIADVGREKTELSAEALASNALEGAAVGGLFGGVFGVGEKGVKFLVRPKATEAIKGADGFWKSLARPAMSEEDMAVRMSTWNATEKFNLEQQLGEKYLPVLPKYYREEVFTQFPSAAKRTTASISDIAKANDVALKSVGSRLENTIAQFDDALGKSGIKLSYEEVYRPLLTKIDDRLAEFSRMPGNNKSKIRVLNEFKKDVIKYAVDDIESGRPITLDSLNKLKSYFYKFEYNPLGEAIENFKADVAGSLSSLIREASDNVASKYDALLPGISGQIKDLNSKFHVGKQVKNYLLETASRAPTIFQPVRAFATAAIDGYRKAAIASNAANYGLKFQEKISEAINNIGKRSGPRQLPKGAVRAFAATALSLKEDGTREKTREKQFETIAENVQKLNNDPDFFVELLARRMGGIGRSNPEIGAKMQETIVSAAKFLGSKLPKPAIQPGIFERPYRPSSLEMAKFERYLQAIEQPLSVLDELKRGTLTREHVEALQAVYPAIYRQMQITTMQFVASNPNISYANKLQLGILLGVPADSSLAPKSVLMLQASISGQTEGEPPQAPQPRAAGLDQLDISGRAETQVEKVEQR